MREAKARGNETYADLTEVFDFPELTDVVARELQKQLGLLYTPVIRRLSDLGRPPGHQLFADEIFQVDSPGGAAANRQGREPLAFDENKRSPGRANQVARDGDQSRVGVEQIR